MTIPEPKDQVNARSTRYRDNMHSKGYVKIAFWVQKEWVERIKKYVNKLKQTGLV